MSSCLSGGTARAYGFDLENLVKLPSSSTSTRNSNSNSSSPSSTLSESSNSLTAVATRKPRTPRKRPNQTYNEAASLLSTACPTIFSITTKNNTKQSKLPNQHTYLFNDPPELLLPLPATKTKTPIQVKPREIEINRSSNSSSLEINEEYEDDFDTESLLDEEIEEGIESIIGNSNSTAGSDEISDEKPRFSFDFDLNYNTCYGYPVGLGIGGNLELRFGFGLRNGVRALRNVDEGNWWDFPAVTMMNVLPPAKSPIEKKKKKVEELMEMEPESLIENGAPLMLKLNYETVLKAWSDKGSPLPEEMSGSEAPGSDIHTKLAQIDLFSDNGEEGSVTRYKEKRRSRFFSKKIGYQVPKVNADQRPRSKGRFVRRPNSPACNET